jgi:hypothetical protein
MTAPAPRNESRSLRVYARLLQLYPTEFLQQHRAEMLQNFSDLEEATASKTALWLLIGKDLTMSLVPQFFASRLGNYVVAVLVAWMLLFAVGYVLRGSTPGHPALHTFGGFLLGMFSMYVATRLTGALQNGVYVIGILVALISLFTFGYLRYASTPDHPVLQVVGGVLLGMLSMYIATRLYGAPPNGSPA